MQKKVYIVIDYSYGNALEGIRCFSSRKRAVEYISDRVGIGYDIHNFRIVDKYLF